MPRGAWNSTVAFVSENCVDGLGGWVYRSYICNYEDFLLEKGYITPGLIRDAPRNTHYTYANDGRHSFMLYPCGTTGRFALFWTLRSPSAEDAASVTAAETAGCPTSPRITYGMRAATMMQF